MPHALSFHGHYPQIRPLFRVSAERQKYWFWLLAFDLIYPIIVKQRRLQAKPGIANVLH